jgi:hypothetical protein
METKIQEVNPFEQKLKPLLQEGEVFLTNAPKKSERMVSRIDETGKIKFEKEESGSQLATRLASYGGFESLRVLGSAFDVNGKPIEGMVALVGKKIKQG